jgi:hypothetical protein
MPCGTSIKVRFGDIDNAAIEIWGDLTRSDSESKGINDQT